MSRDVLWDSSAILALVDADDADHATAKTVAEAIAAQHRPSFITNYIEVETHALLLARLGRSIAREWLLTASLPVVRVRTDDEAQARQTVGSFEDKDWSLCDAISFAVMKRRAVRFAFSFDHHFDQHGGLFVLGFSGAETSCRLLETQPRKPRTTQSR